MCFFHATKQFFDSSCVSYCSTLFWHYLPRDSVRSYSLVPQDCTPTSDAYPKSSWSPVLLTGHNWVPTTPSPWFNGLLECSQNLEKHFTYKITSLLQKDVTQEQPDRRDIQGKVWGQAYRVPMPSPGGPFSQHFHMYTSTEVLWTHPFGYLWRLCYISMP